MPPGELFKIAMNEPRRDLGAGQARGNRSRIRKQICRNPKIYPGLGALRKGKLSVGAVENGRLAI
jgi:hypothetical protein